MCAKARLGRGRRKPCSKISWKCVAARTLGEDVPKERRYSKTPAAKPAPSKKFQSRVRPSVVLSNEGVVDLVWTIMVIRLTARICAFAKLIDDYQALSRSLVEGECDLLQIDHER